jgi:aspartyl-tRNA(Asn)/glutamyl-tRNA(Gln) amidotransferase subunit A
MNKIYSLIFLLFTSATVFSFQLEEAIISDLQTAFKKEELTCEQLVLAYIDRIKKYDLSVVGSAPINAITEINRSALDDARKLDKDYKTSKKLSGPLHCVPIVLKDNIDSFDTTTTAGSFSLLGNQPIRDADLTKQLREAGAIILAKGGMDEFAWGMKGINSRNGRIGNAYNGNKNPGGSSGGPAAAVSANFALAGIGSDNSGSLRIPAAFNGLVSLRPSTGLISQTGMFPMGKLDGIAGPITRTVGDLAVLLDVIASDGKIKNKYTAYLHKTGLQNKRIGIVKQVGNIDTFKGMPEEVKQLMKKAYSDMEKQGATFVEIKFDKFDTNRDLNQAGEIQDINNYLNSYPASRKDFHDICESNRTRNFGDREKCLVFMKKIDKDAQKKIKHAKAIFLKNKNYVEKIMNEMHVDALFIPISTKGIASYDGSTVNTWRAPVSSNSGMPSISFIIGYLQGMPVGIELVARQYAEPTLIEMAYAYEIQAPKRQLPLMPEGNQQVQKLSIAEFNNFINQLGKLSYEKVLKKEGNDEKKLTPEVFREIAKSLLH